MKKSMALVLVCAAGLVGCVSNNTETVSTARAVAANIGKDVTTVDITHYVAGETIRWTATDEEVDSLRTWVSELEYELVEFGEEESPGDSDGGEVYDFVLTQGDYPGFSYIINGADNCYLLNEDCWYSVANPSNPPVTHGQASETVQFHDKTFEKSDLSQETIEWLDGYHGLTETDQLSIGSIPSDLYILWGYSKLEDGKAAEIDFDNFLDKLDSIKTVEYVHPVMEHAWGQRVVRFYDPDYHIIEVGENMKSVCKRYLDKGMTNEEISQRMGIPLKAVKAYMR